ncbi:MAG: DegT/DnrJ/EryC1/StrS family aminotransferase [Elusimicrobiales bacterium]
MKIPHSRPCLGEKETAAVIRVIKSGMLAQNGETARLEAAARKISGIKHAAAVSSGMKALELALAARGVGPGDEVIIPSYCCSAPWHAVMARGARAALADCDPNAFNPSRRDIKRAMTRRTKAVILPNMFGLPCDPGDIAPDAPFVIQDCAHSFGATVNGRFAGALGDACTASFYATKLMAAGEGGMVLSDSAEIAGEVRDLREYDKKPADKPRQNAKLTDLQAALALVQMRRLREFISARQAAADMYDAALSGSSLVLPLRQEGRIYFRYVVRVPGGKAQAVIEKLNKAGIAAHRPVFRPLHLDAAQSRAFPGADEAFSSAVSLPLYPGISGRDIAKVCSVLLACTGLR